MRLIVGLGNPGRTFAQNRHNVGFICISYFARQHHIRFDRKQSQARIGSGKIAGDKIILAKPQTYMNQSGESVSLLVKRFAIDLADLVVIHDDLDLLLGKIRIRKGSGSGGHKGVDSIITQIGSQDFIHLRVGIGRPVVTLNREPSEEDIISYLLSDFTPQEKQGITKALPQVSQAILCLISEGLTAAMNRFN